MPIPTRWVGLGLAVTAAINVVGGLGALAMPDLVAGLLYVPGEPLDGLLLRHHLIVWAFVVAVGLGDAVASRDPERQTALVLAAGLGKLAAVAVWLEMVIHGLATPLLLGGIAFDGALGVLFLAWVLPRLRPAPPRSDR